MYFKVKNHLETVAIERDIKKGCIHYHGTLEASRQTDTLERLCFGTDVLFESCRSLVGKFAGVGYKKRCQRTRKGKHQSMYTILGSASSLRKTTKMMLVLKKTQCRSAIALLI
jgi:hypothetical protein